MRTWRLSSKEKVVAWPGMIACKRIMDIPLQGRKMDNRRRQQLLRVKGMARAALGATKVDCRAAAQRIGPRVLEKLYA